jgi:hypothetical protein
MPLELNLEIHKPVEELFDLFADHIAYLTLAHKCVSGSLKPTRAKRIDSGCLHVGSSWRIRAGLFGFTQVTSTLTEYSPPTSSVRRQEGGVTSETRFSFARTDTGTRLTVRLIAHQTSAVLTDEGYLQQNRDALVKIKEYLESQ